MAPNAGIQFTCFTSTKVQIPTPEELFAVGNYALGTQFTCFTSTKVQILTQVEQFAVGNYVLALEPLGIDPATVPPNSALAFVRHAPYWFSRLCWFSLAQATPPRGPSGKDSCVTEERRNFFDVSTLMYTDVC